MYQIVYLGKRIYNQRSVNYPKEFVNLLIQGNLFFEKITNRKINREIILPK